MYQIHLLSVNGHIPTKAPDGSVGYDVYSGQDIAIHPDTRLKINTDLSITPPPGTYAQIMPHSGLALHHY